MKRLSGSLFVLSLAVFNTGCPSLTVPSEITISEETPSGLSTAAGSGSGVSAKSAPVSVRSGATGGLLARVCQPDNVSVTWITRVPTDSQMSVSVGGSTFKCANPDFKNEHEYQNALNCSEDNLTHEGDTPGFSSTQAQVSVQSKDSAGNSFQGQANVAFPSVGVITLKTYADGNTCGTAKGPGFYQQGYDLESGSPVSDGKGDLFLSMTQDSYGIASIALNAPYGMKILNQTRMCDVDMADFSTGTVNEASVYEGGSLFYRGGVQTAAHYTAPFSDWRNTTFLIRTHSGRIAKVTQFKSAIDIPQVNQAALTCWSPSTSGCADNSKNCEILNYLGAYGFKFAWFFADSAGSFGN